MGIGIISVGSGMSKITVQKISIDIYQISSTDESFN